MYSQVHATITIESHPRHQTCGGYFVAPYQAEQQSTSHRIGGMRRAEPVQSSAVSSHQMDQAFQCRFVRRAQTAHPRFEYSRAGIIAQSDSYTEADQYQHNSLPITAITPYNQSDQQHIQRNPCGRATDIPHQPIEPLRVMAVDPKQYVCV